MAPPPQRPPIFGFEPYTPHRTLAVRAERERRWLLLATPKPKATRVNFDGTPSKPPKSSRKSKPQLIIPPALMSLPAELRDKIIAQLQKG